MRFLVPGSQFALLVSLYSSSAPALVDEPAIALMEVASVQAWECRSIASSAPAESARTHRAENLAWNGLATDMTLQGKGKRSQTGPVVDRQGARSVAPRPPSRLSSRLDKPSGTLLESRLYRRSKKKAERQPLDRLDVIYPMHSR